jgi:hypothetical protein
MLRCASVVHPPRLPSPRLGCRTLAVLRVWARNRPLRFGRLAPIGPSLWANDVQNNGPQPADRGTYNNGGARALWGI